MPKPQYYQAKVAEHIELNQKYHSLRLELVKPNQLEFAAGQYISIAIGGGERRAYSIASTPATGHAVDLLVDIEPAGKGSTYMKNLQPGDPVEFLAPLGIFTVAAEPKLLFVATGSGIAPFKSMIFDLLEDKKDQREIWLLWGLRKVEEMFWEEEWRQINEFYSNFHYRLMISKPPGLWPLVSGHVDKELEDVKLNQNWGVYLCGNQAMIAEVEKIVQNKGVLPTNIHKEKYA
jgi:Na+-transporting NADH:ubiquinone oxidoreductase subunit F